ncbi:MAG TPA: replication-associated recombination protein A [Candidatus Hydrogenedentes bacterium]|nr:replication-associated recombination protein A [Candidatus Hydrogenedentota bacterium]
MDEPLFEHVLREQHRAEAPLARRVAPKSLDDIIGQEHILGPGQPLRRAIESDRFTSLILYGPPGTGKTALARVIARRTKGAFSPLNAVTSGVADLRRLIAEADRRRLEDGRRTIVFIDEIHRFNCAQQDALLPDVENGRIILIGATTENPFFSVNAPLLSRSLIFEFRRLEEDDLVRLLERALAHPDRGLPDLTVTAEPEALRHIARCAEGDARRALTILELCLLTGEPREGQLTLTPELAAACSQRKLLHYDGTGDAHYDMASAFIKSMRGSHPDAALYWMARMLEAGETPRFIARRICIAAAEDVGNADPQALVIATAAFQACEWIGMPEARIILAQAATYVACAPKSNAAYLGIGHAQQAVREAPAVSVPGHLQDTAYSGAKRLGRGEGYLYPHDYPGGYIPQDYGVARGAFYQPTDYGYERIFRERLAELARQDRDSARENQETRPPSTAEGTTPDGADSSHG